MSWSVAVPATPAEQFADAVKAADTYNSVSMTGHANHGGAGEGTDYTASEFVCVNVQRVPESKSTEGQPA